MILNSIQLKNFRCHKSFRTDFGPGITGIVGDTGKGKSSIIEAILFLFTGEGYNDKEKMVCSRSPGDSWVAGEFELNGKVGRLQRWVSASKVRLEYDGQVYIKASEVAEAWAKYMCIDKSIFKHVIVAKQGDIAALFNGDDAIREKIFQRIFMVPPTEKIRTLIWDKFIKNTPPVEHEENVTEMQQKQQQLQAEIDGMQTQLQAFEAVLQPEDQRQYMAEQQRLMYEKQQLSQRPNLLASLETVTKQYQAIHVGELVDPQQITTLQDKLRAFDSAQQIVNMRNNLQSQLNTLGIVKTADELSAMRETVAVCDAGLRSQWADLQVLSADIKKAESFLSNRPVVCPTCGQKIAANDPAHTKEMTDKLAKDKELYARLSIQYNGQHEAHKKASVAWQAETSKFDRHAQLLNQLYNLPDAQYDEQQHRQCKEQLNALMQQQQKVTLAVRQQQQLQVQIKTIENALAALPATDMTQLDVRLQHVQHCLRVMENNQKTYNERKTQYAVMMSQLRQLVADIEKQTQIRQRNFKNKYYADALRIMYDTLHSSKFPRILIDGYSDIVENALQYQLQQFDMPYNITIQPGFKFKIMDELSNDIPDLSGGQQIMAGLCLRLALHTLFSAAFPMMIIDEGTTHLSSVKKVLYFDVLRQLRATKAIKQLIVIDHDPGLGDCVDRSLSLD